MVQNMDVVLKRFEHPDEVRTFEKGKFEIVRIGGMTIGRATYEPGWRWSLHVGPATGTSSCSVEHVGIVVSGRATAAMDNGTITEMCPQLGHKARLCRRGHAGRAVEARRCRGEAGLGRQGRAEPADPDHQVRHRQSRCASGDWRGGPDHRRRSERRGDAAPPLERLG